MMENSLQMSIKYFIIVGTVVDILKLFHKISIKCQAEIAVTANFIVLPVVHLFAHRRDIKEFAIHLSTRFQFIFNVLSKFYVFTNERGVNQHLL